jgi:hypothetical protein
VEFISSPTCHTVIISFTTCVNSKRVRIVDRGILCSSITYLQLLRMATAISTTCFASIFDPCARYVRPSSEAHCQGRQTGATGKLSSSRNCSTASITSGSQVNRSNRAQDQWLGHTTWWRCRSAGEGLGFASTKRRFSLHLSWQNQSIRSVQHSHFFLGSSARYSSREPASNA